MGVGEEVAKKCECTKRTDHNYALWFVLAHCIQASEAKPHTFLENETGITDAYASLVVPFFNQPLIKNAEYRTVWSASGSVGPYGGRF